jgi:hypothetical protein
MDEAYCPYRLRYNKTYQQKTTAIDNDICFGYHIRPIELSQELLENLGQEMIYANANTNGRFCPMSVLIWF